MLSPSNQVTVVVNRINRQASSALRLPPCPLKGHYAWANCIMVRHIGNLTGFCPVSDVIISTDQVSLFIVGFYIQYACTMHSTGMGPFRAYYMHVSLTVTCMIHVPHINVTLMLQ